MPGDEIMLSATTPLFRHPGPVLGGQLIVARKNPLFHRYGSGAGRAVAVIVFVVVMWPWSWE